METEQLVNDLLDAIDSRMLKEKTIAQFTYGHIAALYEACLQLNGGISQYNAVTQFVFGIPCKTLKNKINMNKKLNVAFLVSDATAWQYDDLYKKLLGSYYFSPSIIVTPYFTDSNDTLTNTYSEVLELFKQKQQNIFGAAEGDKAQETRIYGTVNDDGTELLALEELGQMPDILLLLKSDVDGFRGEYDINNIPLNILVAFLPTVETEDFNSKISSIAWKLFIQEKAYFDQNKKESNINGANSLHLEKEEGDTIEDSFLKQLYKAIKFAK